MRVGLLITSIGNYGYKGFYNAQEIGFAKELDKLFSEVIVYKAVSENQELQVEKIEGCANSTLYQIPIKNKGTNGLWDCNIMDTSLDALIYFSDTQIAVPKVYKWCYKNNVVLFPYIGVVESHSTNLINKAIIDILFFRNIKIYKKCLCFAKTPIIEKKLNNRRVKNTIVAPVGLDMSLLEVNHKKISTEKLKRKYGYSNKDKVILFIGRLVEEKQPVKMIEILYKIRKKDSNYKLLIVGNGRLEQTVKNKIKNLNLENDVQMISQIPNSDIWELYCFSETFVNLNQQEIFGMAILEAMYYGCKVIAWHAPGPDYIIENEISGYLIDNEDDVIAKLLSENSIADNAHKRIVTNFTWKKTANIVFAEIYKIRSMEKNNYVGS